MIRETFDTCPSCGYPRASHITYTEGESPPEIYCPECHFEWVASRGNLSPEDEATAHRGLREEAAAYRGEEWWENEDKHAAAIDAAYEENQIREIEEETCQENLTCQSINQ